MRSRNTGAVLIGIVVAIMAASWCAERQSGDGMAPQQATPEPPPSATAPTLRRVEGDVSVPSPAPAAIPEPAAVPDVPARVVEVVDLQGQLVAGATLAASRSQASVTALAPGRWSLSCPALEHELHLVASAPGHMASHSTSVWPPPEETLRVVLRRAVRVRGRVRFSDGEPAAGARLRWSGAPLRAGASGRSEVELAEGLRRGVDVSHPEGHLARPLAITPAPGLGDVEIVLERGWVLEIQCEDMEGTPVAHAQVSAFRSAFVPPDLTRDGVADAQGFLRLEGLPAGTYVVMGFHEGHSDAMAIPVQVPPDGQRVARATVHLPPQDGVLAGVVQSLEGAPIAGARVRLEPALDGQEAVTDVRGAFRFRGLRRRLLRVGVMPSRIRDRAVVHVDAPGWQGPDRHLVVFDQPVVIQLGRSARVIGRCVDEGGEPINDVSLAYVTPLGRGEGDGYQHARGRVRRGRFRMEAVMATPGTLKIHAMARGLSVERPLSPRVGETLDLGDLVLRPMGHRVSVVLEGPTGVDLRDVHGRLWGRDAQGRIHPLAGIWGGTPSPNLVPPGVHQVIGKIPGFFCRAGPVDVRPNDPNPLRVRLIPLADVMLRLPPSAPQGTAWTCTYEGPHVVAARWHGAKGWDPMKQSWDWEPGSPRRSGRLSASREVDMASVPPGTWRLEVGEAPQVRTCRFEVPEGVYLHRAELSDLLDEGAGG